MADTLLVLVLRDLYSFGAARPQISSAVHELSTSKQLNDTDNFPGGTQMDVSMIATIGSTAVAALGILVLYLIARKGL